MTSYNFFFFKWQTNKASFVVAQKWLLSIFNFIWLSTLSCKNALLNCERSLYTALLKSLQRCLKRFWFLYWPIWDDTKYLLKPCLSWCGFFPFWCWRYKVILSILTRAPVPSEEKHPHGMILPAPCFTVGLVFFEW